MKHLKQINIRFCHERVKASINEYFPRPTHFIFQFLIRSENCGFGVCSDGAKENWKEGETVHNTRNNILNFDACAWSKDHVQPPKANTSGGVSTSLPLTAVI